MPVLMDNTKKMRACVIGAGAAGLVCARHLSERADQFTFDVFEQTGNVGGIWNYSDVVGVDNDGLRLHTAVYTNMRTNLPIELMEYPDFPSHCERSFVTHKEVLNYMEDYAKHFQLNQHINFYQKINKVSRVDDIWSVTIEDVNNNFTETREYDAMFVCNGKYAKPKYPDKTKLKGLETFKGSVIHSHDYRVPNKYHNKTVLVLGGGPSASDISVEISDYASRVIICHLNDVMFFNLPPNVTQENTTLRKLCENTVELYNGKVYDGIDDIIFATGYHYSFNFLDESCNVKISDKGVVEGLYMHFINTTHPTMSVYPTLQRILLPCTVFHQQCLLFIKVLTKQLTLPSKTEMDFDSESDQMCRELMGMIVKYPFYMVGPNKTGKLLFDYSDKLCSIAGLKPCRPVIRKLYDEVVNLRTFNMTGYREINFKILSDYDYISIKQ